MKRAWIICKYMGKTVTEKQTDQKTINALSKVFNKKSTQPTQEQAEWARYQEWETTHHTFHQQTD